MASSIQRRSEHLHATVAAVEKNKYSGLYKKYLSDIKSNLEAAEYAHDFDKELSWINTTEPLSIHGDLKGKIVVLDFWTYCCINCMHILPDLHELEKKFSIEEGLVVIGVHCPKFPNEREHNNIVAAVQKYGIEHAVVNDRDGKMWNEMGISCWPTIVILGPKGLILTVYTGEGHRHELLSFVECALEEFKNEIGHKTLPIAAGQNFDRHSLRYPTKVLVYRENLVISDAGNRRVVLCSLDGDVKKIIGSGKPGYKDGNIMDDVFVTPQGLSMIDDIIYVADSDTHQIRKVNLSEKTVITVAGTGIQGYDRTGGGKACEQPISSPWDVKLYSSKNRPPSNGTKEEPDMLLVAMAGTHQIWAYFLKDTTWWKNTEYKSDMCVAIVGSGSERNKNNSYPMKAALAQPSGLTIDPESDMCYIADSESSTVRQLSLREGVVKGLVGGALDPTNLFAFGDQDGKGMDAKLQHPLDVCTIPHSEYIIVCDSYNHKLKLVNTKSKLATTLPVEGLNEPGGLSYDERSRTLYIADTNNHCIKKVVLPSDLGSITELEVIQMKIDMQGAVYDPNKPLFDRAKKSVVSITHDLLNISSTQKHITLRHKFGKNETSTNEQESRFRATFTDKDGTSIREPICSLVEATTEGNTVLGLMNINVGTSSEGEEFVVTVELELYYCADDTCRRTCVLISQPVKVKE